MPVAWRALAAGAQTFATGNTTSGQVTLPADLKGGDTCYLVVNFNPTTGSPTTGLGAWTQVGSDIVFNANHHAQIYKKTAAGTTGATSTDAGTVVTIGGYGTQRIAGAVACGRTDGTEDIASSVSGTETLSPSGNAPAVVVSDVNGADTLAFVMQRSSTPSTSITNSSGLTSVFSVGSGSGACSMAVGFKATGTANGGTQPATTWSQSPAAQTGWILISMAVGIAPNTAPIANAGPDQSVGTGSVCTLDGSGSSDPDGDTITYAWTKTSGPAATLSSSTAQKPTFTPSSTGTYVFSLVVTDSHGTASSADTVSITATNSAPTANAGTDQVDVDPFDTVTLDGSASFDPDGTIVSYAWVQTAGASVGTISGASTAHPTFVAPGTVAGTVLTFRLTVVDNGGTSATDTVNVTVFPHTLFRIGAGGTPEPVNIVAL